MKYRLQYFDQDRTVLAIQWAHSRVDYEPGDFYVRAIKETTSVSAHNKANNQRQIYTRPHSIDQARVFIGRFGVQDVHDCVGLALEDERRYIDFDIPILFRNMPPPPLPRKEVDAAAIKYGAWLEVTRHMLITVWGEERAKIKLAEYRPPQELVDQLSPEQIRRRR